MSKQDLNLIYWLSNAGGAIGFSYLVILFQDREITDVQISLLAIPFSIALILSNTIFGRLSDERGRRKYLLLGLISSGITMGLYVFPRGFWSFAAIRLFHGIAMGVYPNSITGIASDRHQKLGNLTSFGSLGWGTGSLLGGIIAEITGIDSIFIISSFMFFISFLISYWAQTGKDSDVILMQQIKANNNTGSLQNDVRARYMLALRNNWKEYLLAIMRHGTANSIWIYWALFLKDDLGISLAQIGMVQMTNMGTQFVFMKLMGDRFNPRKSFVLGGVVSAIAFISFPFARNFIEILLTQVILGISWCFFLTGSLREVERKNRDSHNVATATGLLNAAYSSAQIIGPLLALVWISLSGEYTFSMFMASSKTKYVSSPILENKLRNFK